MQYIKVKVKPNAKRSLLSQQDEEVWLAELKAPPVDGKANAELIRLIADHFGCARSEVTIKSGGSGRLKLIKIEN